MPFDALKRSDLLAYNLRNRDAWVAARAAEVLPGSRVLDAGAGSSPYRPLFKHCRYETQDFAQLQDAQLRHGGYAAIDYVCDITHISVPDATFDVVLCTEVLEHHPEPIKVVGELARVLKPGGLLLLTAPLGSGIHQEPYHFYGGYTSFWYRRFLPQAGFADVEIAANAGSLRHIGQEAIRFIQMTRPFGDIVPARVSLLWAPFWIALLPVLAVVVPWAARRLDRYDTEKRFTVGYHVRAVKSVPDQAA
jgi:ubiquinone/menaquinone biosynthesis C-methylase UbiE